MVKVNKLMKTSIPVFFLYGHSLFYRNDGIFRVLFPQTFNILEFKYVTEIKVSLKCR